MVVDSLALNVKFPGYLFGRHPLCEQLYNLLLSLGEVCHTVAPKSKTLRTAGISAFHWPTSR